MKAVELLRLYKSGRRDFRGANLRGESFKGQDLSDADFSGADIRSANFTNANLTGVNFTQAKNGLQRRWAVGLVVVSLLLSVLSGILSSYSGIFIALIIRRQLPSAQTTISTNAQILIPKRLERMY